METSVDGRNFTQMPNLIPFGWNQAGGCAVIIDDETVFYAGGENSFKGPSTNDVHSRGKRGMARVKVDRVLQLTNKSRDHPQMMARIKVDRVE